MEKIKLITIGGLFWLAAGCTWAQGNRLQIALGDDPEICKHCNCYMPGHLKTDAPCPVCDCRYKAGECYRGK